MLRLRAWRVRGTVSSAVLIAGFLAGCLGGSEATTTTTVEPTPTRPAPAPTTTLAPAQGAVFSPEFIQGAIPGAELVLLVGNTDPEAGPLMVTAEATNATVTIEPSRRSRLIAR